MEEIFVNIDSKYRDLTKYPNESKFRYTFEKAYKNVVSVKMVSLEINNSLSYVDAKKGNNFFRLHLPNKKNDPTGVKIQLDEGFFQLVSSIENMFNGIFVNITNTNFYLSTLKIDNEIFAEKYFYIFYLNSDVELTFDFNSAPLPVALGVKFKLKTGWHSVYGVIIQIQDYITQKYNIRKAYKEAHPATPGIDLDNGNFIMDNFILNIFDRRFRNIDPTGPNKEPSSYDSVRLDYIKPSGPYGLNDLTQNLNKLKQDIYSIYIYDQTTWLTQEVGSVITDANMGILDRLSANRYEIGSENGLSGVPIVPALPFNYARNGTLLESTSKYILNNATSAPTINSTQIYNLKLTADLVPLKTQFINSFSTVSSGTGIVSQYYYYYVDPEEVNASGWNYNDGAVPDPVILNTFSNLIDKNWLRTNLFITSTDYLNYDYKPNLIKDIAQFEINFDVYSNINQYVDKSNIVYIKNMQYPSVGYYLGFRPNVTKDTDRFLVTPIWKDTDCFMTSPKLFNTIGDTYIFMKINDWGYFDFFNQKMFAKVLMTTGIGNPKLDDYVNKEYRFRQPQNLQRLDIELIDYLGNPLDLNGFDFSFTLELKVLYNSDQKNVYEKQNMVFTS